MKKFALLLALVSSLALTGCTAAMTPVFGGLFTQTKGPVSGVDNDVSMDKKGVAEAQGIVLVGIGDASIEAAMRNGGITKIHHIDHESMSVLGVYSVYRTIVYGE